MSGLTPNEAAMAAQLEVQLGLDAQAATPPEQRLPLRAFVPQEPSSRNCGVGSMGQPLSYSSAEVASAVASLNSSDMAYENELRGSGQIAQADEWKAGRAARTAERNADLGYTPPVVNAAAVAAAEYNVNLEAKPADYRAMDLRHVGLPPERLENLRLDLSEMMASIKLGAGDGQYLGEEIARLSAELRTMTPEQRAEWSQAQDDIAGRMGATRQVTLKQLKDGAKSMLSGHPLGRSISESAMLSSPALLIILLDHSNAVKAFEKSKRK